jgi:Reverse transcriptase (RNA-dependent DNA polymerase)
MVLSKSLLTDFIEEEGEVHDGAHAKVRAKLQDKGLVAMFVGYPDNHAGKVCQFLNITTHWLIIFYTKHMLILFLKFLLKLQADLEERLWMDLPEGYVQYIKALITNGTQKEIPISNGINIQDLKEWTHFLEFKKAIYGLVQTARQWWKKFKSVILEMGYKPSLADPCLFYRDGTNGKTKSFIIIHVDDGGIFRDEETIQEVITELGKTFKVKYLGKLKNSLGVNSLKIKQKIQFGYTNQSYSLFGTNLWALN